MCPYEPNYDPMLIGPKGSAIGCREQPFKCEVFSAYLGNFQRVLGKRLAEQLTVHLKTLIDGLSLAPAKIMEPLRASHR